MARVIKMKGLPWAVTEREIVEFFRPLPVGIESITLITGRDGRPSGEGYVWIHANNLAETLTYDRKNIGSRYVLLYPSDEAEYNAALRHSNLVPEDQIPVCAPTPSAKELNMRLFPTGQKVPRLQTEQSVSQSILRVRGLPYAATPQDLLDLFVHYHLDEENIHMCVCSSGSRAGLPNGDAFLRFESVEIAQRAMTDAQGTSVGDRYLELFAATESELEATANIGGLQGFEANQGLEIAADINLQENRPGSGWLRLKGIPFASSQTDIIKWAGECARQHGLTEDDVTIKFSADGRPSGEAFIQVDSADTAWSIKHKLNRLHMGERYVDVFVCTYEESQGVIDKRIRATPYGKGCGKGYGKSALPKGYAHGYCLGRHNWW